MVLMASLTKAFSYLIAAQVQAVGLIVLAYWSGGWLNKNYPMGFNWFIVTTIVAVLGIAQTFYVVLKAAMQQSKAADASAAAKTSKDQVKPQ